MSFFIRRETQAEQGLGEVEYMDDIDMIIGAEGKLVVVAIKKGQRVCQRCAKGFDQSNRQLRPVEVTLYPGSPPIMLHAMCESANPKVYVGGFDTLRLRRKLASVARASETIVHAAVDAGKKIVGI